MVTIQLVGIDYQDLPSAQSVLTVAENTVVPITFEVGTIKDLSTKKGGTTKTVVVKGDKQSNQVLGFLFDVNIETGLFNRKAKTPVVILEDGAPVLSGLMRLLAIKKSSKSNNTWDQKVEYEVSVADESTSFFQSMGENELTDLRFEDLNHFYTGANVIASIPHTWEDGYKYTWNMHDDGMYKLQEFHPAIYAKQYWDRIFDTAGFTYTWTTLADDDIRFDKLLVPYGGGKPKIETLDILQNIVVADRSLSLTSTQPLGANISSNYTTLGGWNETTDPAGYFNDVTGVYTNPFPLSNPDVQLVYTFKITYQLILRNQSGGDAHLANLFPFNPPGGFEYRANHQFRINGSPTAVFTALGPNQQALISFGSPYTIPAGDTTIQTITAYVNTGILPDGLTVSVGDLIQSMININVNPIGSNVGGTSGTYPVRWYNAGYTAQAQVDLVLNVDSIEIQIAPSMTATSYGSLLRMDKYVPKKIKQRDFIKGIMTLYNLYAIPDPDDKNNLIIQTRDDFYDAGATKDWTEKLCLELDSNIQFAPNLTAKRLTLTYKQGKDPFNVGYQNNIGQTYGEVRYSFDDENVKGENKIEIMFEPSPLFKTTIDNTLGFGGFGMYVNALNGLDPVTGVRLIYDGGEFTSDTPYWIEDYDGSVFSTSSYAYTGHFDDPVNPTFDLNFGVCDFYFYDDLGVFTPNNQYNMHWRRTLGQINDGKVLTASFFLDRVDIQQLQLNDKIFIKDSYWNIQKVSDYDASQRRATVVELITIDRDQDFAPYKRGGKPVLEERVPPPFGPATSNPGTKPVSGPAQDVLRARQESSNTYTSSNTNRSAGSNNFFGQGAADNFAIGSDNVITGSKSVVIGDNITTGATGAMVTKSFNVLDAGQDIVLNPFDVSGIINVFDASQDEVRNLGSNTTMNVLDGGEDAVL